MTAPEEEPPIGELFSPEEITYLKRKAEEVEADFPARSTWDDTDNWIGIFGTWRTRPDLAAKYLKALHGLTVTAEGVIKSDKKDWEMIVGLLRGLAGHLLGELSALGWVAPASWWDEPNDWRS